MSKQTDIEEIEAVEVKPKNAITKPKIKAVAKQVENPTIENMMMLAVKENNIETLERLMALKERYDKIEAEKAFNEAMNLFQEKCPLILKKTDGYNFKYAALEDIVPLIKEPLKESGLSFSHTVDFIENGIKIVCSIQHVLGHAKHFPVVLPVDAGTKQMNNIQKVNSTITYGKRTTLKMGLGIIEENEDDDGNAGGEKDYERITDEQAKELNKGISIIPDRKKKLLAAYKINDIVDLPANKFEEVNKAINYYVDQKSANN